MIKINNLIIIGTSHIARESIKQVKEIIIKERPDIVALELDKERFLALIKKQKRGISLKDIRKIGFKGFLFALIASFIQKKLSKIVKVEPGSEMISAFKAAKKINAKIALIDRNLYITLSRISKYITRKEKINLIKDILAGIIFRKRQLKKLGVEKFNLRKVPEKEIINRLLNHLKEKYPGIYKALVYERDLYMARNLAKLIKNNKVVAVVGAGHEANIARLITKFL